MWTINKFQGIDGAVVTPSDSVNLPKENASLYVGTGGDVKVKVSAGAILTFKNVPDGSFMPIQVLRVYATGTTATDILALY